MLAELNSLVCSFATRLRMLRMRPYAWALHPTASESRVFALVIGLPWYAYALCFGLDIINVKRGKYELQIIKFTISIISMLGSRDSFSTIKS